MSRRFGAATLGLHLFHQSGLVSNIQSDYSARSKREEIPNLWSRMAIEPPRGLPFHPKNLNPSALQLGLSLRIPPALSVFWKPSTGELDHHEDAIKYFRRGLVIMEKTVGFDHPTVARLLDAMAIASNQCGQHEQAMTYSERALKIKETIFGCEHPDTAQSLTDLGNALLGLGHVGEAISHHERALASFKERKRNGEAREIATWLYKPLEDG